MRIQLGIIDEDATDEQILEGIQEVRARDRWLEVGDDLDLVSWWFQTATQDLVAALPKVEEYGGSHQGSADLEVMGDALAVFAGMKGGTSAVFQEMACWFYVLGKVSRLISDYRAGRSGKADTWHDISVYSMMARRLQECGRWP